MIESNLGRWMLEGEPSLPSMFWYKNQCFRQLCIYLSYLTTIQSICGCVFVPLPYAEEDKKGLPLELIWGRTSLWCRKERSGRTPPFWCVYWTSVQKKIPVSTTHGQSCAETLGRKSSDYCRDQGHYISSLEEFVKRGILKNKNL